MGVAYLEEGLRLREEGLAIGVLVLGGIVGFADSSLRGTTYPDGVLGRQARRHLRGAGRLGLRAKVHLKIDTGMERIGVHWYSAEKLLEAAARAAHVEVEGIFTHFASADEPDLEQAKLQLERFQEVLRFYERRACPCRSGTRPIPVPSCSCRRATSTWYGRASCSTVRARPRLSVSVDVKQALRWLTHVVFFKVVRAQSPVSYGGRYVTRRDDARSSLCRWATATATRGRWRAAPKSSCAARGARS